MIAAKTLSNVAYVAKSLTCTTWLDLIALKPLSRPESIKIKNKAKKSQAVQRVDKQSEMTFVHVIGTWATPRLFSFLLKDFDFLSECLA